MNKLIFENGSLEQMSFQLRFLDRKHRQVISFTCVIRYGTTPKEVVWEGTFTTFVIYVFTLSTTKWNFTFFSLPNCVISNGEIEQNSYNFKMLASEWKEMRTALYNTLNS